MRRALFSLALATLPLVHAFKADIRANTNRDGQVALTGDSDTRDKDAWTEERGAFLLANIGDTNRRCSLKALSGPMLEDAFFGRRNDASDDVLRHAKYLAPLRTVPIGGLPNTAVGSITVDENAARFVRIFHQSNGTWNIVTNSAKFSTAQLITRLELGIDSRETRRPSR